VRIHLCQLFAVGRGQDQSRFDCLLVEAKADELASLT
jgi:hypothetical protein